ncbi:MAG TPA: hypothetical protein VH765_03055 [Xanthobacteraceae bacterium]|jgi:hypothetical protein
MTIRPSRLLTAVLTPIALAACLETASVPQYYVPDSTPSAKTTSGIDQIRTRLDNSCREDSGAVFPDAALIKQCDCFASTMLKQMSKEDREFYVTYNEIPTLSVSRPDDVKKRCGMAVFPSTGPRAKLPKTEGY